MGAEAAAVMQAAGGVAEAFGSYQEGKQQKMAYDYNAGLYRQQAESVRAGAALDEFRSMKEMKTVLGAQTAGYAGRGVKADAGSPIDVAVDSSANAYLDMAIERYNSEVLAKRYEAEAGMSEWYGKRAKQAGKLRAMTTLLKTGGDLATSMSGPLTKQKTGGNGRTYLTGKEEEIGSYRGYKKFT